MEYSPMMMVMLWALTPSDATGVAAKVKEVPTAGMTVHQESYFTFNHGKPFLAEQDPLTGAILNLKTTPVVQEDYAYDEEEEADGIDRKDGPKVYTRNDIAQPSKDQDLHKFLNLPVHYSSSGKFPLISSSYANTKVQGHGASAYSNHRLSPTTSTSTVSPSYYSLKTSTDAARTERTTSTTTTTAAPTTTTTRPTTVATTTKTIPKTSTTTPRPVTARTTTKPPASYEYEYEYEYDHEQEKEPTADKKPTTHNILDFFDKDYDFLGTSGEEKNASKVEYILPSSTEKPKNDVVMIAPNTNIFIPADYLKPAKTEKEKENKTEVHENTTNKPTTISSTTPTSTTTTTTTTTTRTTTTNAPNQHKLFFNKTDEPAASYNESDKIAQSTESFEVHESMEHGSFGMKLPNRDRPEMTTNKRVEVPNHTSPPVDKRPIVFVPTRLSGGNEKNKTIHSSESEEEQQNISSISSSVENNQDSRPSDESIDEPSGFIEPPARPTEFHYPYQKPGSRPHDSVPQQNGHYPNYNPYQKPFTPPTMVPTEMLPPKRPSETHYQRPQERPYPELVQYRPIDQNRPQNIRPMDGPINRPPVHSSFDKPEAAEQTTRRPPQPFQTSISPIESITQDNKSQKQEPKPFVTMSPGVVTRPEESTSMLISRPHGQPQRQESKPRPVDVGSPTKIPDAQQKPSRLPNQPDNRYPELVQYRPIDQNRPQNIRPIDGPMNRPPVHSSSDKPEVAEQITRRPPFSHMRPQEPDQRPHHSEYRPPSPRPEPMRTPIVIPDFVMKHEQPQTSIENQGQQGVIFNNKKPYPSQFSQPSKVESHFIKVSPGQENPSYALQTSFSIGVPPADDSQQVIADVGPPSKISAGNKGVGQVFFPDEEEKRPWAFQEEKRPTVPHLPEGDKYPRPPWESHLKPPLAYNHLRKEPYSHKRPKPRPDLPNILPQFRPNAKVGHIEPQMYFKTPLDTLQPPPLPRPQFLRAESEEEKQHVHRRNGISTRVQPSPVSPVLTPHVPKRGALRSEDEKADPVFVVYPSNNAQDGVVVGTRGPQRPLPPDNLEIEDSFPLDTNKNFQARVDTPILKGKSTPKPIIKNEFPYPLVKPTELVEEKVITTVTKEYTAFSPTVSPTEKEHDTEINVIPYLQDYQPFATKKPSQEPPTWNTGNDTKPISVTLKTHKTEATTTKTDNHKSNETPTPQDFQAPFYASLSAPNQGWSVLRPRPDPEKEEEATTEKMTEEEEGKFDIQNFKPQLFGGFKPIIPPVMEEKGDSKEEKSTE